MEEGQPEMDVLLELVFLSAKDKTKLKHKTKLNIYCLFDFFLALSHSYGIT